MSATPEQLAALDAAVSATTAAERRAAMGTLMTLLDAQHPLPAPRQRDPIPATVGGKFRMDGRVYTISAVDALTVTCTDDAAQAHRWARGSWDVMAESAAPEEPVRIR